MVEKIMLCLEYIACYMDCRYRNKDPERERLLPVGMIKEDYIEEIGSCMNLEEKEAFQWME